MNCTYCGHPNHSEARFCRECGKPLFVSDAPLKGSSAEPLPVSGPLNAKPNNYLLPAILSTVCCCLPFGIVSIVYAAQVDSKWSGGDFAGALKSSENAKMWFYIALGLGLVSQLFLVGLQVLAVMAEAGNPEF